MDFKQFRKLSILKVCDLLSIKIVKNKGTCPCCGSSAFKVTPSKALWYCFKCHENGDSLQLVVKAMKTTHREAARQLVCHFGMPPY